MPLVVVDDGRAAGEAGVAGNRDRAAGDIDDQMRVARVAWVTAGVRAGSTLSGQNNRTDSGSIESRRSCIFLLPDFLRHETTAQVGERSSRRAKGSRFCSDRFQ